MARSKYEELCELDEPVNIFQSKENHHPLDQLLRRHGFRIHSRKNNQEAVWTRNNAKFTESQALALIPWHEVTAARMR